MNDDLLQRLLRHAPTEGRIASVIPGVWFFRHDRPTPPTRYRASTLTAGLVVQGRKAVRVEGTELWYDDASYFVVRGETVYEANVAEAPYLAIGLEIPPQVVVETLLALGPAVGPAPAVSAFVAPVDAPLRDAMVRLVTTAADPVERRILTPLVMREVVYRLLCTEAAAVLRSGIREAEREPIRAAMAWLEAHADRRVTVQQVARQVGMSASHFAHRFRETASTTPMQYLKHVRMDRARTLLEITPAPRDQHRQEDYFGNDCDVLEVLSPHERFEIVATSEVELKERTVLSRVSTPPHKALEGKYPQFVLFQLTGKRCGDLNAFREGDEVRVEFALRGREWKSRQGEVRFFNSLDVLRLEAAGGARDDDRDYVPSGPPPGFVDDEDVPF